MSHSFSVQVFKLENPATMVNLIAGQEQPLEAFFFDESGFQVLLPIKKCAEGQFVEFAAVLSSPKQSKKKISGSAKVIKISPFNSSTVGVQFELKETKTSIWKDFISRLNDKNEQTAELFEKVRGW